MRCARTPTGNRAVVEVATARWAALLPSRSSSSPSLARWFPSAGRWCPPVPRGSAFTLRWSTIAAPRSHCTHASPSMTSGTRLLARLRATRSLPALAFLLHHRPSTGFDKAISSDVIPQVRPAQSSGALSNATTHGRGAEVRAYTVGSTATERDEDIVCMYCMHNGEYAG